MIYVLGAMTGNGHFSVLKAIEDAIKKEKMEVKTYPSFYEDVMESNKILSNFYNIVQMKSMELGVLLNEIMVLEGSNQQKRLLGEYFKYFEKFLKEIPDIIISVTPLINRYIKLYLQEKKLPVKFYIVVTDPYVPMYPGFDIEGADKYFVPNKLIKEQLLKSRIEDTKIIVSGLPLNSMFGENSDNSFAELSCEYNIKCENIVTINCGTNGSFLFLDLIKQILQNDSKNYYFFVICGNNKPLYLAVLTLIKKNNAKNFSVFGYVDNMGALLAISKYCITKPGASSIYECLVSKTMPLIVSFEGLFYQERGVFDFLKKEYNYDLRFYNNKEMVDFIFSKKIEHHYYRYCQTIGSVKNNAAEVISCTAKKDLKK